MSSISVILTVRDGADLDRILAVPRVGTARIALKMSDMRPEERSDWEYRLNRDYNACGCESGAIMLVAALAVYVSYLATRQDLLVSHPLWLGVIGLAIALLSTGIGKGIGMVIARFRLKKSIEGLREFVSNST